VKDVKKSKVGFWQWLWDGIKEMPNGMVFAITHPFFQTMSGMMGCLLSIPFFVKFPFLFPLPIVFFFFTVHGLYRMENEEK